MRQLRPRDELLSAEPNYGAIVKTIGIGGWGDIRALVGEAEDTRALVRALLLCGVYGRTFPERVPTVAGVLREQLDRATEQLDPATGRRVRVGVSAAAVEMGRAAEGVAFRDDVLTTLLGDADVAARAYVLHSISDNQIPLEGKLKEGVDALAADQNAPTELRELAEKVSGGPSSKSGA